MCGIQKKLLPKIMVIVIIIIIIITRHTKIKCVIKDKRNRPTRDPDIAVFRHRLFISSLIDVTMWRFSLEN